MSVAVLERRADSELITEQPTGDNLAQGLTDPEQAQVLGVDTEAILRLGRAITDLEMLPSKVRLGCYALPETVELVPLVEKMQSDTGLEQGDVTAHRKPIIRLAHLGLVDGLAATAEKARIKGPRRVINNKLEQEFPVRAQEKLEEARRLVASIENEIEFVAGFENPKQQFDTELQGLAREVSSAIIKQRDTRIESEGQLNVEPETPTGIQGFFVKAFRKVRSFLGVFSRSKPAVNPEVTAYDAGIGIEHTIHALIADRADTETRFPLFSKFLLDRLAKNANKVTPYKLALVAPEILAFLFSTMPSESAEHQLLHEAYRNAHEFRFAAGRIVRRFGYSLERIQRASATLLPALRDVLPSEGTKVREIFTKVQNLVQSPQIQNEAEAPEEINVVPPEAPAVRRRSLGRLKDFFRKAFGKQKRLPTEV